MQARRFSRAMKAPLIFCSTSHSINVQKIFKIVLSKGSFPRERSLQWQKLTMGFFPPSAFDLKCTQHRDLYSGAAKLADMSTASSGTIPEITEVGEPLLIYLDV